MELNKLLKNIFILSFFVVIYLFFASNFTFKFFSSRFNYHNLLAEAFLRGKLYLISTPSQILDLSLYDNKFYLYFPPAPALVLIPFVYLFGKGFSDVFLTAFIGGLSCFVFYNLLIELKKSKIVKFQIKKKTIYLLTLFFSLGTNHFYVSLFGSVWWTAHIFAVFFLNCSLFFLFRFLNTKNKGLLVLSSIFFSLASLSRFPTIFALIFLIITLKKYLKEDKNNILLLFTPIIIISSLFSYYNYLRFGSPFELGYKYQQSSNLLDFGVANFGKLSPVYIPINLYHYLLHPYKLVNYFPFYKPFYNGNSIFLLSPLVWIFIINFKKGIKKLKLNRTFGFSLMTTIIFIMLPALFNYSPGGPQIGYRFALDFHPFFLLLLLFFVNNFKSKISIILLLINLYFGLTSPYIFNYQLFEFWN